MGNNNTSVDAKITTTNVDILKNEYKLPNTMNSPHPGNLSLLYTKNSDAIYNKYSAKTDYSRGLLGFGPRQPFISFNPNSGQKGLNQYKRNDSNAFPIVSGIQDSERIGKFLITGNGVKFLGTQILLQGFQPFNETKIYNPASPILATARAVTFGLLGRPLRHIEPTVGGLLGSIGLSKVADSFGLNNRSSPPGTVGYTHPEALGTFNSGNGKGLIRGSTATNADKVFNEKWGNGNKSGMLKRLGNYFKNNTLLGGFIPIKQPNGEKYKVGEKSYGAFLRPSGKYQISFTDKNDIVREGVYQRWYGGTEIRLATQLPNGKRFSNAYYAFIDYNSGLSISGEKTGLDENETGKYGDVVGIGAISKDPDKITFKHSDVLVDYSYYTNKSKSFPSTLVDEQDLTVKNIRDNLDRVVNGLETMGYTATYQGTPQFGPKGTNIGMDFITHDTKTPNSPAVLPYNSAKRGYLKRFEPSDIHTLDNIGRSGAKTRGFNKIDSINSLGIVDKNTLKDDLAKRTWSVDDDLVSFFFYDIINEKIIPFRSSIDDISDTFNAEWDDISYLGRSDKLYTYKGFTRDVSMAFTVIAGSIQELLPMWKRINYFCGLVKPAGYTGNATNIFSQFVIPPMVELTLGNLYQKQPVILKSIALTIPKDALWETTLENKSQDDWKYLNNSVVWKGSTGKYAQFPRTATLSITMTFLEKDRPQSNGVSFAHYITKDFDAKLAAEPESGGNFSKNLKTTI